MNCVQTILGVYTDFKVYSTVSLVLCVSPTGNGVTISSPSKLNLHVAISAFAHMAKCLELDLGALAALSGG